MRNPRFAAKSIPGIQEAGVVVRTTIAKFLERRPEANAQLAAALDGRIPDIDTEIVLELRRELLRVLGDSSSSPKCQRVSAPLIRAFCRRSGDAGARTKRPRDLIPRAHTPQWQLLFGRPLSDPTRPVGLCCKAVSEAIAHAELAFCWAGGNLIPHAELPNWHEALPGTPVILASSPSSLPHPCARNAALSP